MSCEHQTNMPITYVGAPGCGFKPTKYRNTMLRHLERKAWCECKDIAWTMEDAITGVHASKERGPARKKVEPLANPENNRTIVDHGCRSAESRQSDGYIDASAMATAACRDIGQFYQQARLVPVINNISRRHQIPVKDVMQLRGPRQVWVHPDLRVHLETWCEQRNRKAKPGLVYLVTSNVLSAVKIGSWKSTGRSLRSRYATSYGQNVNIDSVFCGDCRAAEVEIHRAFAEHRLSGELFDLANLPDYQRALEVLRSKHPQLKITE